MIRTSSVNGSPEMKDERLAEAIELLTLRQSREGWRHYEIAFDVQIDPEDQGSRQVEHFALASWPLPDGEPRWKKFIRHLLNIAP